jgi:DNA polymerase III gamma/tau subunit
MASDALDLKYRPQTLDDCFGHEKIITRLRGMIKTNKLPNALAFFGPPSAGKTTLARCIAAEINGKPVAQQGNLFKEINAGTTRGIDDVRELDRLSSFRALNGKRFILIDEAQALMTSAAAAKALCKPLEEPGSDTVWIICSMEPEAFNANTTGQAILSRCTPFFLDAPSPKDMMKQALRIAEGEKMHYLVNDEALLKQVVRSADGSMRALAKQIQSLQYYYEGLEEKPESLSSDDLAGVLTTAESSDDVYAHEYLMALYQRDYPKAHRACLNANDPFQFLRKVKNLSTHMANICALDGEPSNKVWFNASNKAIQKSANDVEDKVIYAVHSLLIPVFAQAMTFTLPANDLLTGHAWSIIRSITKSL